MTIESKGVRHFWEQIKRCCVCFVDAEVTPVESNGFRMANVKPKTSKPDIADRIYVKFQRNPHTLCIKQHSGTMLALYDVKVGTN